MIRTLVFLVGLVLALPLGFLVVLAFGTPTTLPGKLYLLGALLVAGGALSAPWAPARYWQVVGLGLTLVILVACIRLVIAGSGARTTTIVLPERRAARWVNRFVDEQDAALFGTRLLLSRGIISRSEGRNLLPAMKAAYDELRAEEGALPTPFPSTYLGRQRSTSFDLVVVEPGTAEEARVAVVYLHGFTGNFTLPCWLVARAARAAGALTVCPSVGWEGHWWTQGGAATVRATLDYLHDRGVGRVYLAGLSNGGIGAIRMACDLRQELAGLILISGVSPQADNCDLPVLLVHGSNDTWLPASLSRDFAGRHRQHATLREFDAGHFVLVQRADEVRAAIAEWLTQQENVSASRSTTAPSSAAD